ncbi:MAG: efflux RND transporter periplasmic adaptor subunit [Thermodesulfobacteriota bacterium]
MPFFMCAEPTRPSIGLHSDREGSTRILAAAPSRLLRKATLIAVVVVGVIAGLYFVFSGGNEEKTQTKYLTVSVEKGTLTAEITCTGTLKPLVEVLVGSQVSGTIKGLYADFETRVEKGQLIALIDPETFEAKAAQARADVEAAKAALAKAEVQARDDMIDFKRQQQLFLGQSISESAFDKAKAKADASAAQVMVDKAKVFQAEAKLQEADLQLKFTRIVAPVKGVVTSRTIDMGQTVAASFQAPELFKIAEDLTRMQVHTNVDEADVGRVQVGQKATFSVPAFPDDAFEGRVSQIRNDPKVEQNVVTYNVLVDVDNNDLKLRPGMTANVTVLLTELHDVLMVPEQALRFVPKGKGPSAAGPSAHRELKPGERRLWKLIRDDSIRPVVVGLGLKGVDKVQIMSSELAAGDKVVVEATTIEKKQPGQRMLFRF